MAEELKPCPFCGGEATIREQPIYLYNAVFVHCTKCKARVMEAFSDAPNVDGVTLGVEKATQKAVEYWNRRTPQIVKVETSFYDQEEVFHNCTVQVLTNTATGDTSVGWWKNGGAEE